jgi:hypothetical protein
MIALCAFRTRITHSILLLSYGHYAIGNIIPLIYLPLLSLMIRIMSFRMFVWDKPNSGARFQVTTDTGAERIRQRQPSI